MTFNKFMFWLSAPAWGPAIVIAWLILRFRYSTTLGQYYRWFKDEVMDA